MASVFVCGMPSSEVYYSIVDGRVCSFTLRGVKLYDEEDGTAADGWRDQLVAFVREHGLDFDYTGYGLHAFVLKMQEDGLLPG